jgi:hypothetical protein
MSLDTANPMRGETSIVMAGRAVVLRPSFTALVAAEQELGPLFALVERAGNGQLALHELATLFWHCASPQAGLSRDDVGEAVLTAGLAASARPLRMLLTQILQGG